MSNDFNCNCPFPSYPFPYLLLFDAFIDLGCGLLVSPKQTDDTSPFWFQNVPIIVPNHLVQLQDPVVGSKKRREKDRGLTGGRREKKGKKEGGVSG